jgi:HlyD family secretion protein
MAYQKKKWLKWIAAVLVLGAAGIFVWQRYFVKHDEGLASGNGRIEATDIDVAAKIPARIKEILVHEGDFVRGVVCRTEVTRVGVASNSELEINGYPLR